MLRVRYVVLRRVKAEADGADSGTSGTDSEASVLKPEVNGTESEVSGIKCEVEVC